MISTDSSPHTKKIVGKSVCLNYQTENITVLLSLLLQVIVLCDERVISKSLLETEYKI